MEDVQIVPGHTQASRNVWKFQDNDLDGNLAHFLRDWKVNVEGRDLEDHFPESLTDDVVSQHKFVCSSERERKSGCDRKEMLIF